ncbi:MAG: DUF1643 domain-containing protein [Thermoflexales bacterium]|nr:DUF1643 domain-containing protein [Thermoflexales bacterium]
MQPLLGGIVYTYQLDKWKISWESDEKYRHWCLQEHSSNTDIALVVMFNPGSLSGDGANLRTDTTLRILREVFCDTGLNPLVVNLFDFATPKINELYQHWSQRDKGKCVYSLLPYEKIRIVVYAYGDYENKDKHTSDVKERIRSVRSLLAEIPEIIVASNRSGTPKHPMNWQREGIKSNAQQLVRDFYRSRLATAST